MAVKRNDGSASTVDREIVVTRLFNAPKELVFQAWTDPTHLAQWWGPTGFSLTTIEMEFRPGGMWRYVMHGPDGTDYGNKIVYTEITPHDRITYQHGEDVDWGEAGPMFNVVATFETENNQTRLTMRSVFRSAAERDHVAREYGAVEGAHQTIGRLASHLDAVQTAKTGPREIFISRTFEAPRDLVFKAWTDPDHFSKWWGPAACRMISCTVDLRPGGSFTFSKEMPGPDGPVQMRCKGVYRVVAPPERLSWTWAFVDDTGEIARHPLEPLWPLETQVAMTLTERDGRTTMEIRQTGVLTERLKDAAEQGWASCLGQLTSHLAKEVARAR